MSRRVTPRGSTRLALRGHTPAPTSDATRSNCVAASPPCPGTCCDARTPCRDNHAATSSTGNNTAARSASSSTISTIVASVDLRSSGNASLTAASPRQYPSRQGGGNSDHPDTEPFRQLCGNFQPRIIWLSERQTDHHRLICHRSLRMPACFIFQVGGRRADQKIAISWMADAQSLLAGSRQSRVASG